jgi:hypothetical protein
MQRNSRQIPRRPEPQISSLSRPDRSSSSASGRKAPLSGVAHGYLGDAAGGRCTRWSTTRKRDLSFVSMSGLAICRKLALSRIPLIACAVRQPAAIAGQLGAGSLWLNSPVGQRESQERRGVRAVRQFAPPRPNPCPKFRDLRVPTAPGMQD